MGSGGFKQPPEGPKIGPEKKPGDLPEEKRRELGDLGSLVSQPAELDPRVAAAEKAMETARSVDALPPAYGEDKSEEGAARLEALQNVLAVEPEPEMDPAEAELEEAAEPTVAERQEFMRCAFGNRPYTKSFELFGGVIRLKMVDLTPVETDELFEQLATDQQSGVIKTVDDWNTELDRYRLAWMTAELVWGDETLQPHKESLESLAKPRREALNAFLRRFKGSVPYRAMLRATRIFQRHLDKLVDGALDSDFWEVGGPDSQPEPTSGEPSTTE
jgi:hypothetical protein